MLPVGHLGITFGTVKLFDSVRSHWYHHSAISSKQGEQGSNKGQGRSSLMSRVDVRFLWPDSRKLVQDNGAFKISSQHPPSKLASGGIMAARVSSAKYSLRIGESKGGATWLKAQSDD